MRRSSYSFRRFGYRKRFGNRRYRFSRRRRKYPLYRSIRNNSNKSVIRMGYSSDFVVWVPPLAVNSQYAYIAVDWANLINSVDFNQYQQLYSTFIPMYFKVRWVPNIQSNASGNYIPGGVNDQNIPLSPLFYNMTDGFSTTRYDNVDSPIPPTSGVQYTSFKTFNPSRNWKTIVYPRRSQMTAPRQQFDSYNPAPPISETIRGMGRLWLQFIVSWEDSNNIPPEVLYPPVAIQNGRLSQLGHIYVFFYLRVYDRK